MRDSNYQDSAISVQAGGGKGGGGGSADPLLEVPGVGAGPEVYCSPPSGICIVTLYNCDIYQIGSTYKHLYSFAENDTEGLSFMQQKPSTRRGYPHARRWKLLSVGMYSKYDGASK